MHRSSTTVADLLREGTRTLREARVESPGLDAEVLLRHALALTREQLFDALPHPVRQTGIVAFRGLIRARVDGTPIAYITGLREFYGRDFVVNESVLVPRPETEHLVEKSVNWLRERVHGRGKFVDVGSGSGAIAVSVAAETAGMHVVVASDVSLDALTVAARNLELHQPRVDLVAGSLLEWTTARWDVIAANLPYLRPDQLHPGIEREPAVALFAGPDGFALNRALIDQAGRRLNTPGLLIMELDPAQADLAVSAGRTAFTEAKVSIERDLAGTDRYLVIEQ